ncbi:MAG TPA: S8 family serine peptidase [Pyrinomonadaceae bacterium]|nr:S8 family serine peptidase [Pyrinomonadaceae bacterium]
MKFIQTFAVLILIAVSGAFLPVFADPDEEFAPDEVVIKLRSPRFLRMIAKRYRLSPAPIEQFGTRPIYRMRILDGANPETRAAELQNDLLNRVEFAEPNFLTQAPEARGNSWSIGGTSTQYANQWFREQLRIPMAHQQTQGAGVKIAVLDTGIDLNHPAFAGHLIAGYDFVNDDANPSEEGVFGVNSGFGHGTHVAGLASLVAPQAQIMPIRVLDANGVGNIWVLAEALRFAADPDGNPATPDGADVINLSLATRRETTLLAEIIAEIACGEDDDFGEQNQCAVPGQRGIVVAAGAGNRTSNIPEYPAAENIGGVIAVAGSNQMNELAAFSNFGSWIDVAAPGQQILSTVPGGGYGTWSGTSMSTPLVAGTAALVRAQNPDWTAVIIEERIVVSSVMLTSPNPPQRRIDVAASVGQ